MSRDLPDSPEQLVGATTVPRSSRPVLRGSIRRLDPDGVSSVPYVSGLNGKSLKITYTDASTVEQTVNVTFVATGEVPFSAVLSALNAAAPAHVEARDAGGYLELLGKHSGGTHHLTIKPQTSAADDAAPLLGLSVHPFPGSTAYAGELATSPASESQGNPRGTAFLTNDEDLSSASINRALYGVLSRVEALADRFSVEVAVPYVTAPLPTRYVSGVGTFALLDDASIRLPINLFSVSGSNPGSAYLSKLCTVLQASTSALLVNSSTFSRYAVDQVVLADLDNFTSVDLTRSFNASEFQNPATTGRSIFGSNGGSPAVPVSQVLKHGDIAIAEIRGNNLVCPGAYFLTRKVQVGDTLVISGATNLLPFSHNGEFVVEEVFSEERLAVRRKINDAAVIDTFFPIGINAYRESGETYGSVKIPVGHFLPAENLAFRISAQDVHGTYGTVRLGLLRGVRLRDLSPEDLSQCIVGSADHVLTQLYLHTIADPAHAASKISISAAPSTWAGGNTSGLLGTQVEQLVRGIISELASTNGALRIGSSSISALTGTSGGAAPPYAASGASIQELVQDVLQRLADHAALPVHGGATPVGPFAPWPDGDPAAPGNLNHASTHLVEAWLADLFTSLTSTTGSHSGAHKIGVAGLSSWPGGVTNTAGNVFAALNQVIVDLQAALSTGRLDGASKIGSMTRGVLGSGTVGSQLDEIVGNGGAHKAAVLAKDNGFLRTQTINVVSTSDPIGDPVVKKPAIKQTLIPSPRVLWGEWASKDVSGLVTKVRMYILPNGYEYTYNAWWNGSAWEADVYNPERSWLKAVSFGVEYFYEKLHAFGVTAAWTWDTSSMALSLHPWHSTASSAASRNTLVPHALIKAQARIELSWQVIGGANTAVATVKSGMNISSVVLSGANQILTVTFSASAPFTSQDDVIPTFSMYGVTRSSPNDAVHCEVVDGSTVKFTSSSSLLPVVGQPSTFIHLHVTGKQSMA